MQEFNRFLDISSRYFKGQDTEKIDKKVRNLMNFHNFQHLNTFGPGIGKVFTPASSDDECEDAGFPSVYKVARRIIDTSFVVLNDEFIRTPHCPCFFVSPVSQFLKDFQVFGILNKFGIAAQSCQIVDLNSQFGRVALLWFQNEELALMAFERFLFRESKLIEAFGRIVNVKWVDYKALYPNVQFFAVVVRGFSKNNTPGDLRKLFNARFNRCEIRTIDGIACGLFVFNNLEDLCQVCLTLNGTKDSFGDTIKVHLHPLTQKKHSKAIFENLSKKFIQHSTTNSSTMSDLNNDCSLSQGFE